MEFIFGRSVYTLYCSTYDIHSNMASNMHIYTLISICGLAVSYSDIPTGTYTVETIRYLWKQSKQEIKCAHVMSEEPAHIFGLIVTIFNTSRGLKFNAIKKFNPGLCHHLCGDSWFIFDIFLFQSYVPDSWLISPRLDDVVCVFLLSSLDSPAECCTMKPMGWCWQTF